MTAIAITQLVAEGAVAYHEKLPDHVDGFTDPRAAEGAVHHLLTHSSGFRDFHGIEGFWPEATTGDRVEELREGI